MSAHSLLGGSTLVLSFGGGRRPGSPLSERGLVKSDFGLILLWAQILPVFWSVPPKDQRLSQGS